MNIEANIYSRKLSEELMELGLELARESFLPAKQIHLYWSITIDSIKELIGEKESVIEPSEKMTESESKHFGSCPFPFGKHIGVKIDNVPVDYLEWLVDESGDFIDKVRRYLNSDRIRSERQ